MSQKWSKNSQKGPKGFKMRSTPKQATNDAKRCQNDPRVTKNEPKWSKITKTNDLFWAHFDPFLTLKMVQKVPETAGKTAPKRSKNGQR